jgi:branched-chain amino acid transport system permease protein
MPKSAPDRHRRAALRWTLLAAVAITICGAFVLDGYWLRALTEVFLIATIAQSINIIAGFTGYAAFGQVVFFGLGNYAAAIAMTALAAPFVVGALLGSALCAGFALLCGWPLFRLKGHYFAIATLGLNEAVKAVISNWVGLMKGGAGISLPLPIGAVLGNARMFYIAFLTLMWIGVALVWSLRRTRFGFACRAIRTDEEAAAATGINPLLYKTGAWMLSAVLAGWAGCLYAYWQSYIEPSVAFDMDVSVRGFVILLLGGPGSVFGPIVAAFGLQLVSTLVWSHLLTFHLGMMGMLIMAVVLFPSVDAPFRQGKTLGSLWRVVGSCHLSGL